MFGLGLSNLVPCKRTVCKGNKKTLIMTVKLMTTSLKI